MAILSNIKNTLKKIGSAVKTAFTSNLSNNYAAANKALDYSKSSEKVQNYQAANPVTPKPTNTQTGVSPSGTKYYNNYVPTNSQGAVSTDFTPSNTSGGVGSKDYGPSLPVPVSADPRTISQASSSKITASPEFASSASSLQGAPLRTASLANSASTNGSAGTLSGGGYGLPSSGSSNASAPRIDTTGLAGGMSGLYTYNDKTGQFEVAKDLNQPDNTLQTKANDRADLLKQYLGVEPSVYEDKQVKQAMRERNALRESLQAPTAELNAVLAKQQQDLLQLRATGAQEGVTEAVYGQQQNAINYAAAVRALPLQASIANIQGQIDLAQDYIKELVTVKTEQIKRKYEYNKQLFDSISGLIDKEDERSYQELKTKNDRDYKEQTDLEKFKGDLIIEVLKNGGTDSAISRINTATDRNSAIQAAGRYVASPDTQLTKLDNGDTVLVNTRNGQIISNIGGSKAKAGAPTLTPQQASDPFIAKLANSAGGKPITDTFAQKLDKGLTVLGQIGSLQASVQNVKTGPIVGAFKGANPWDTNAQTIKAQLNSIVPNLARGVYGEVGVLTDNDIAQYSKTLPNLKSTEDVRNAVLGITVDTIGKSIKRTLEVNAANGKDVSGFIDLYTEMTNTRDSIFSQIPGYQGGGQENVTPEIQSMRSKYNY